jgi:GNAT superfamily N-acetyltransferase
MFRFEWDDEEEPEHPVLFCHEFQVEPRYWRKGLGRRLMQLVTETARSLRMWKTMLTVFKRNLPAMHFYLSIGFNVDANSPSSCGYNSECYEILSCK